MRCPYCGVDDDKVIDSRATEGGSAIRRRRECLACKRRFTTYEHIEQTMRLVVVKKDGTRVPFDRDRVLGGLRKACYKRPVSAEALQGIAEEVEEEIYRRFDKEVESVEIGHAIAERLKIVDQVAYVRFASVYKQFASLDELAEEVRDLLQARRLDPPGQGKLF